MHETLNHLIKLFVLEKLHHQLFQAVCNTLNLPQANALNLCLVMMMSQPLRHAPQRLGGSIVIWP